MAARYPIEQFPDLNLPGFQSSATIWDIANSFTDWQPTLSLSIYSRDPMYPEKIDVLTGIRTDGTETHPHVVSTPTGRFPHMFQAPILESRKSVLVSGFFGPPGPMVFNMGEVGVNQHQTVASFRPNMVALPDREDPLAYVAHEPLGRKLGIGEALQKGKDTVPVATISLSEIIAGFSYAADDEETGTPLWEPLLMYAGVMMVNDRDVFPSDTVAYRKIGWTGIENFLDGQENKKAEKLVPTIDAEDEATVCVRGLCLTATGTVTVASSLRPHLGM